MALPTPNPVSTPFLTSCPKDCTARRIGARRCGASYPRVFDGFGRSRGRLALLGRRPLERQGRSRQFHPVGTRRSKPGLDGDPSRREQRSGPVRVPERAAARRRRAIPEGRVGGLARRLVNDKWPRLSTAASMRGRKPAPSPTATARGEFPSILHPAVDRSLHDRRETAGKTLDAAENGGRARDGNGVLAPRSMHEAY